MLWCVVLTALGSENLPACGLGMMVCLSAPSATAVFCSFSFAALFAQYVMECSGTHAGSDKCLEMKHTVEQLEDQVEVFDNLPVVFYVQGAARAPSSSTTAVSSEIVETNTPPHHTPQLTTSCDHDDTTSQRVQPMPRLEFYCFFQQIIYGFVQSRYTRAQRCSTH